MYNEEPEPSARQNIRAFFVAHNGQLSPERIVRF
jgi:hypothetical protein